MELVLGQLTTLLPETGGATALQLAAIKGYIGIARRLIDLGASVNEAPAESNGRTALQGAAECGRGNTLTWCQMEYSTTFIKLILFFKG